jgi:hypothetical protein
VRPLPATHAGNLPSLVPFAPAASSTRFDRLPSRHAPAKLIRTSWIAGHELAALNRFARFQASRESACSAGRRPPDTAASRSLSVGSYAVRVLGECSVFFDVCLICSPYNLVLRPRQRLIDERGERLVFLRRASHCACVVTLLVCCSARTLAQSQPPSPAEPAPATDNQNAPDPATQTLVDGGSEKQQQPSSSDIANGFIAVFTFILAIVAVLQYRAMRRQADYMREGLIETRKAADAATASADAARVSASIAIAAAEQADRPWLNVKVHMTGPLVIDSRHGAFMVARLLITNVGRSAAQHAQVIVGAMISRPDTEGQLEVKRIVDAVTNRTLGEVVLPTETLEQDLVLGISMEDIKAVWSASPTSIPDIERVIDPIVFGCVRYTHGQSMQGPKFPRRWHATTFGYHVARIDPASPEMYAPITIGRWEVSTLRLVRSPHGFSYAD